MSVHKLIIIFIINKVRSQNKALISSFCGKVTHETKQTKLFMIFLSNFYFSDYFFLRFCMISHY